MEVPETKYAWNGNVALAYQVFGEGHVDLVYMQGGVGSHVDLNWESPYLARFLRGLGQHARVIHTDRRGWGCSDRFSPGDVAPLEVQVDDLAAVMDAAGSERAVIFGSYDTGLPAMLFAATNPDRTAGLVLCDPFATYCATEETPWTNSEARWEEICEQVRSGWGTPGWAQDEGFSDERERLDWFVPWSRASVAPGALVAEVRAFYRADVRAILPSIHCAHSRRRPARRRRLGGQHDLEPSVRRGADRRGAHHRAAGRGQRVAALVRARPGDPRGHPNASGRRS